MMLRDADYYAMLRVVETARAYVGDERLARDYLALADAVRALDSPRSARSERAVTRCGCPSSADQHPPRCSRCGHCAPHWLNGSCARIGCSKCPQVGV